MSKRIILCSDGTWNAPAGFDSNSAGTNVWKLYCAVPDTPEQLKFYDSGVGTRGNPIDHLVGGAIGQGLFDKVQDCYSYLSHVHDPGDSIYLFGFSRGAYTARSVGGMIAAFGVPTKNLSNATTSEIFAAYRERDHQKRQTMKAKLTDSYGLQPVTIAMIGVWDTVGALGIPGAIFRLFNENEYGFLDTKLSDCVAKAYHAISIDERRAAFQPTLWTDPADGSLLKNSERVEQVWFTGVHCDVGGSYSEAQLANITLGWMMHKAVENGIELLPSAEPYLTIDVPNHIGPTHDEWKLVPYGVPKHREIPAGAHLANSVFLRWTDTNAGYRPENLTAKDSGEILTVYQTTQVLPYKKPVWV
jgi:uncharacterized protein (DUF2235 family)